MHVASGPDVQRIVTRARRMRSRRAAAAVVALVVAALLALPSSSPAEVETFKLLNGDIVRGEVLERDATKIVIRHPFLGRLEIPVEQVAPASSHPGLLGTSILAGWTKELNIGLGGSQGDTDEADLRVLGKLEFKDDDRRWRLEARYTFGLSNGKTDDNAANITALRDWLWKESKWFAFAYGLYDFDEFESWKHRVTVGTGPGYHLLALPTFTLDGRGGPFFTYEFGDDRTARPELALGLFATWKIRDGHSVDLNNIYYQTLDEGEFRLQTRLDWKVRLSFNQAVSVKFSIFNEYDSASKEGQNNLNYFTSVVFEL